MAVLIALAWAWHLSAERHLSPKEGIGYWLGISGALLILAQILYPMRKHMRRLRGLGSVAVWFRMHMLLGIVGPLVIAFHSGYRLDSKNATVATLAMLTVVLSGMAGRFLYARLHVGLYGRKLEATQILDGAEALTAGLGAELGTSAAVLEQLRSHADDVLASTGSVAACVRYLTLDRGHRQDLQQQVLVDVQSIISSRSLRQAVDDAEYSRRLSATEHLVRDYFMAIESVAKLRLTERIFAKWHLLHLPLFMLLIITAIMHIVSVHLY